MNQTSKGTRLAAFGVGCALIAPAAAHAGGLYLPGIGPTAQSRGGAFTARADDATALGVNPAGLAKGEGTEVYIGANLVDYALEFTRRGVYDADSNNPLPWAATSPRGFVRWGKAYKPISDESSPAIGVGPFQAVPLIAVSTDLGLKVKGLRFGIGLIAPTAYPTRKFGGDYGFDANGVAPDEPPPSVKYDTLEQEAAVVLPSIAVAYRVNDKLDVGARFSAGVGDIKARVMVWGEANFGELSDGDAEFAVETKDNFVPAFGFGVLYRPIDNLELGFNFDSQVNVRSKGTGTSIASEGLAIGGDPVEITPLPDDRAACAPGGEVGALKACVDIGLPMVTTLGARYTLAGGKADVELDVAYERWSAVSDHHVIVDGQALNSLPLSETDITHGAKDVISVRLGGGYTLPVGANALDVRAGVAMDTAGVKDGWERVDFDGAARTTIATGVAYRMNKLTLQLGGGFVHEGTREVGDDCNPAMVGQGCADDGGEQPLDERDGPDPSQPLNSGTPFESPFNAGTYTSHYVLVHLGAQYRF